MGSKPKKAKVVQTEDPAVTAQKAADLAAQKANDETATRKRRKQESSLLSTAGGATGSVLSTGKNTLGGA